MAETLHLLSGGAAQGLVERLRQDFLTDTGVDIHGGFGAVGAMRAKLVGGEPCDVLILTAAIIDALQTEGRVLAGTARPLGRVRTGVAVRAGEPLPAIGDGAALRSALVAAEGIYLPDLKLATAGIHMIDVMTKLGIRDEVAARLRPFPNGAAAMRELARTTETGLIGCTQITEIRFTKGVALVGPLPVEFELATVYTAGVCAGTRVPDLARRFVELLAGRDAEEARAVSGFE